MLCQAVECPAHATGGGVVALKRERLHLFQVAQTLQMEINIKLYVYTSNTKCMYVRMYLCMYVCMYACMHLHWRKPPLKCKTM